MRPFAQEFINNLLDECAKCGITDIGEEVPETVWHQGGNMTVEDTLREAVGIGQKMFGIKPALILILLPGNGMHLSHQSLAVDCLLAFCWAPRLSTVVCIGCRCLQQA